jgi:hypothetical protein
VISRRWIVLDAAIALVIVAVYLEFASFDGSDGSPAFAGPAWLGWLTAVCVGLPVAVRRLWPLPAAAFVVIGCAASSALDITREPFIPAALALYAVGALEPARRSVVGLAVALTVSAGGLVAGAYMTTPSESAIGTAELIGVIWLITGGGWVVGVAVRHRRFAME